MLRSTPYCPPPSLRPRHLVLPRLLAGLAISATAAGAAQDTAAPAEAFVFAAERPVAVQVSLWPPGLRSGLTAPVFDDYIAQLRFSGEAAPVSCALRLVDSDGQLVAGQTEALALRCTRPFRILPGQPEFQLFAGSRPIGQGRLRAAALAQVMGAAAAPADASSAASSTDR